MKNVIVKTPFECLVKYENNECILSPNEHLELTSPFIASVYPLSRENIPFVLDSQHLSSNQFYDFANLEDSILVCFKQAPTCENFYVSKLNTTQGVCKFEVGENKMIVECGNWKKAILLTEKYKTFETKVKNDIAYIKFNGAKQKVYAFNVKTSNVKTFVGDKIELKSDSFVVENNDKKSTYKITSEGLKEENQTSTNTAQSVINETVAYHFLEEIKNADFASAYKFLSTPLQDMITKKSLKDFFGSVRAFYYLTPTRYAIQNGDGLKIFNFEIQNNKIADISD